MPIISNDLTSFIIAYEKERNCMVCLDTPESMMFDFEYEDGAIITYWQNRHGAIIRERYMNDEEHKKFEEENYNPYLPSPIYQTKKWVVPVPPFTDYETFVRAMLYYEAFRTLSSDAR